MRGRRIAVGDDGHRGAHLGHVGVGESLPEAGREDARTLPDGFDPLHQRRQWRFVGALLVDADRQRRKHRRQVGRDLAVQPVDKQVRRFQAALALVHVRVGAVGDDGVDRVHHARRQVGVRIAGGDDRHPRPHQRADRLQPVAVQVRCRRADAGPVRRDEQPVQRQVRADLRQQPAFQFRVGAVGYQAVGQGACAEQRNRRDAGLVQAGKEACQLVVGALDRVAKRIPCRQQPAAKRLEVRGCLDEGIGLVLQRDDADSHSPILLRARCHDTSRAPDRTTTRSAAPEAGTRREIDVTADAMAKPVMDHGLHGLGDVVALAAADQPLIGMDAAQHQPREQILGPAGLRSSGDGGSRLPEHVQSS